MRANAIYRGKLEENDFVGCKRIRLFDCEEIRSPFSVIRYKGEYALLRNPKKCRHFSKDELLAILYHEYGHIYHDNINKNGLESEFEADAYALKCLNYDATYLLKALFATLKITNDKEPIVKRIFNIAAISKLDYMGLVSLTSRIAMIMGI